MDVLFFHVKLSLSESELFCCSCISWSSYHKNLLASSDYEGTVILWDGFTGQRSKVYQVWFLELFVSNTFVNGSIITILLQTCTFGTGPLGLIYTSYQECLQCQPFMVSFPFILGTWEKVLECWLQSNGPQAVSLRVWWCQR